MRLTHTPFVRCEQKLSYFRRLQDEIDAKMDDEEKDSKL